MYIINIFVASMFVNNQCIFKNEIKRTNSIILKQNLYKWEEVPEYIGKKLINNYFLKKESINKYYIKNNFLNNKKRYEVFVVEDIPMAMIIYENINKYLDPIVETVLYDKNALVNFNVGKNMKKSLLTKHKNINLNYAENSDFLKYYEYYQ